MKLFFTIVFLFFIGNLFSQNDIVIKSKVKQNEILLRWTPAKSDGFKLAVKHGFTLYRKEWNGNGVPPESFWNADVDFSKPIQITDKNDSIWKMSFQEKNDAGILYSFLFPEFTRTKMEEENLFGLALLTCDLNPELAKLTGLYFKDSVFEKGKTYAYKIEINTIKKSTILIVNTNLLTVLPMVKDFDLKCVNQIAEISWNYKSHQSFYSGYFIERSEDSIYFEKLNERAYLPMASQYEKNKEITFYSDTSVKVDKTYWYRLAGRDHFGETGEYSKIKKVFVAPSFIGEIVIDTLFESKENIATLNWKFTNEKDKSIAKFIQILRSDKINGNYQLLKEIMPNETKLEIDLNERENYIKVVSINDSEKMESWPYLVLIPDRIPPMVPDSLVGNMDRNGKVKLTWKKNVEKDLRGYRVFRTNALHEEMVEVSHHFILKNVFEDSVDIKSLTEEIYFSVNAVDSTYNNSKLSAPIKLLKPDYIPPVAAPIITISPNEKGNLIRWINSTSTDVLKTELRRSKDGKIFEMIFTSNDSTSQFLDTLIESETGYYYRTIVVDDANNFSESESVYMKNSKLKFRITSFVRERVQDSISVTVNRENKFIQLKWFPLKQEVYSYTIYKAKKGEILRSFKTVNGNILELKDDELYISNEYVYAIKAILKSGREVMVAEDVKVEY